MPRPPPHRPISFPLTEIQPRPHRWLWPGRIPLGKLTFLSGDPGVGKSRLAADLAARATAGLPWPDGQPAVAGPVDVLLFCAEDEPADTLRPRVAAAGGDLSRAHAVRPAVLPDGYVSPVLLPRDCRHLERALIHHANPRLIVLDPLAAYLGPAGDSGSEIQSRLLPLLDMAERSDVAILAVTHRDLRPPPLGRRCAANLAHLASARVAFHLDADPLRPDVRRLRTIKNNLATPGPALSFRMNAETIEWLPPAPDAAPPPSERVLAAEWLAELLKEGPVPAADALAQADAALVCRRTLRRAARDLGLRVYRKGYQGPWHWELQPVQTATPANVGHH